MEAYVGAIDLRSDPQFLEYHVSGFEQKLKYDMINKKTVRYG